MMCSTCTSVTHEPTCTSVTHELLSIILHTVRSFVEMGRYLLNFPGVKFLLSERFTQDPLESFFGQQRQRGGGSDNPNVLQFIYTTSSIRAHNTGNRQRIHGNE